MNGYLILFFLGGPIILAIGNLVLGPIFNKKDTVSYSFPFVYGGYFSLFIRRSSTLLFCLTKSILILKKAVVLKHGSHFMFL